MEEGAFVELVNRDIAQPDEEALGGLVVNAGEVAVANRASESHACLQVKQLPVEGICLLRGVQDTQHFLACSYTIFKMLIKVTVDGGLFFFGGVRV